MGGCLNGPVDKPDQCRIGTNVNNATKNGKIWVPFLVNRADQAYGFKTGKAIDEISAVKTLPCLDG